MAALECALLLTSSCAGYDPSAYRKLHVAPVQARKLTYDERNVMLDAVRSMESGGDNGGAGLVAVVLLLGALVEEGVRAPREHSRRSALRGSAALDSLEEAGYLRKAVEDRLRSDGYAILPGDGAPDATLEIAVRKLHVGKDTHVLKEDGLYLRLKARLKLVRAGDGAAVLSRNIEVVERIEGFSSSSYMQLAANPDRLVALTQQLLMQTADRIVDEVAGRDKGAGDCTRTNPGPD